MAAGERWYRRGKARRAAHFARAHWICALVCAGALAACSLPPAPLYQPTAEEILAASGGHRKIGKPYQIAGTWHTPRADPAYDRTGVASWYAEEFHGRPTANGERYDMRLFTAAHPTLPLPSWVEVTNLQNGRKLSVRVNDRGPFAKDREIDLSLASAKYLGLFQSGSSTVRVRYLGRAPLYSASGRLVEAGDYAPVRIAPTNLRDAVSLARRMSREIAMRDPQDMVKDGGWIVQIGTYKRKDSAIELAQQYQKLARWQISSAPRGRDLVYRVHSKKLPAQADALRLQQSLRQAGHLDALLFGPK